MIEPFFLKFLNLQYWYCVIYSLLGGKCADVEPLTAGVELIGVPSGTLEPVAPVGFWSWLFGPHGSGVSAPNAPYSGFLGSFLDTGIFILGLIGGLIAFIWALYSTLAYIASGLLFLAIIGLLVGLFFIRMQEAALYGTLPPATNVVHPLRDRWQELLNGAMTNEPKRWREGILEADVMLGELLGKLGYVGSTTSEQIRTVPESAFVTVPLAWEAHRIRNFVSTPSSNYILTQQEAFRVMKLYEQIFYEFDFI